MSGQVRSPITEDAFRELERRVETQIDPRVRLPAWPFLGTPGFASIFEHDRVLGGDFGAVLAALALTYGDVVVTVVGFEPTMAYYRDKYDFYPGFEVNGDAVEDGYAEGIAHEPGGDPTGALAYTVDAIGIVGSSRSWALWSQRDWEIGVLLTRDEFGPWLHQGVPAFDRDVDLDSIRAPSGWGVALSSGDTATFRRNVRERGSGAKQ